MASRPSTWATSGATRSPTWSPDRRAADDTRSTSQLFDQIWNNPRQARGRDRGASASTSPRVYAGELARAHLLPDALQHLHRVPRGHQRGRAAQRPAPATRTRSIWKKLYNFQRDAATGIINKLETYNGCILADSVGLGKTFTALAVIKYYELRNKSVLVLVPEEARGQLAQLQRATSRPTSSPATGSTTTCSATPTCRARAASRWASPLDRVNWGNYDLVVIDESHNFRNDDYCRGEGDPLPAADAPGHPARA